MALFFAIRRTVAYSVKGHHPREPLREVTLRQRRHGFFRKIGLINVGWEQGKLGCGTVVVVESNNYLNLSCLRRFLALSRTGYIDMGTTEKRHGPYLTNLTS